MYNCLCKNSQEIINKGVIICSTCGYELDLVYEPSYNNYYSIRPRYSKKLNPFLISEKLNIRDSSRIEEIKQIYYDYVGDYIFRCRNRTLLIELINYKIDNKFIPNNEVINIIKKYYKIGLLDANKHKNLITVMNCVINN